MTKNKLTFISGLPRCRSAWLATYAIANGAIAVHEPTRFVNPASVVGTFAREDDHVVLAGHDLIANYPILKDEGNWIIIQRDPEQVMESLAGYGDVEDVLPHYSAMMEEAIIDGALFIGFDELDSLKTIKEVHKTIFGNTDSFNLINADTLNNFDIQPHYAKYKAKAINIDKFYGND